MTKEDKQTIIKRLLDLNDNQINHEHDVHCLYEDLEAVFNLGIEYQKNQEKKSPLDALFG